MVCRISHWVAWGEYLPDILTAHSGPHPTCANPYTKYFLGELRPGEARAGCEQDEQGVGRISTQTWYCSQNLSGCYRMMQYRMITVLVQGDLMGQLLPSQPAVSLPCFRPQNKSTRNVLVSFLVLLNFVPCCPSSPGAGAPYSRVTVFCSSRIVHL